MAEASQSGSPPRRNKAGRAFVVAQIAGLCVSAACAQENPWPGFMLRSWDQDDGLPSTRVNAVARTADGYVWIATGGGLSRFDGVRFTTFDNGNTPELRDSRIMCLLVDRAGTLWAGTAAGTLVRREGQGFTRVNLRGERATRGRSLNALAQDAAGDLWLATDGAGLIRFRDGQAEVFSTLEGLPSDVVSQVHCDLQGGLWAIAEGELLTFAEGAWRPPADPLPFAEPVRAVAAAHDGGLWVTTLAAHPLGLRGGRVFKLMNGQSRAELAPYPWPQDSQRSRLQAVHEDHAGRVWCATVGSGVFLHTAELGWRPVTPDLPLGQVETLCLAEDEEDVMWIGTRTFGLHQAHRRSVASLSLPPEAAQNVFLSVCVRRDGSVWAGTDGDGIFRWRDGEATHFGRAQGLANLQLGVLLEDRKATLWAGTFGGLFRWNGSGFEPASGPPALRETVRALLEDRAGNLWIGTRSGLVCMTSDGSRVFGENEGLEAAPPRALAEDAAGRIWAAVSGAGLFFQDDNRFRRYEAPPAQGVNNIRAMHFDATGALWYATQGMGLFRLKDGAFRQWTSLEDGLPSNHHVAMLEDGHGHLWLSSENGIFGLSKETLLSHQRGISAKLAPWRITPEDGLVHKVCSGLGQPGAWVSGDGQLWFPDGPAIAVFHPSSLPRTVQVWPPVLESVLVDTLPPGTNAAGELAVRSGAVTFEFHYTSPTVHAPERVRYRYRLVGLDPDWVEAGPRRTAYYNRLAPGRYSFRVMAGSPDGKWREATHSQGLEVRPRLHERRAVQVLAGAALIGTVALTVWGVERSRSRRRLARLRLQRVMDQERQRIARDIHDDLGSGLTEIILLSDTLRDETASDPVSEKTAVEISTRARTLTRAMDEVVWAVNPSNDTLEGLLMYLHKSAQEHLTRAGVRCRWDVPLDLPAVPLSAETRHHLYLACKEALNNVVKHAAATEVWVRLQIHGHRLSLVIEDNGRGFNGALPSDRGNGLVNMQRRLEELDGRCEIGSTPGRGTRVEFTVIVKFSGPLPPPAFS